MKGNIQGREAIAILEYRENIVGKKKTKREFTTVL